MAVTSAVPTSVCAEALTAHVHGVRMNHKSFAKSAVLLVGLIGSIATNAHSQVAFWRVQDIKFVYNGHTSLYGCVELRHKVFTVLAELGAHVSTSIEMMSCHIARSELPLQLATFQLRVVSPALATNEIKNESRNLESRRVLLGKIGASVEEGEAFPADWRELDIARMRAAKFGSEDCELLRQLREQVLSKLAVRVIAHDRNCSIQRLRRPRLEVAVLVPVSAEKIGQLQR
jgi:hypothetical protein